MKITDRKPGLYREETLLNQPKVLDAKAVLIVEYEGRRITVPPKSRKPLLTHDYIGEDGTERRLFLYEVDGQPLVTETVFGCNGHLRVLSHETTNQLVSSLRVKRFYYDELPDEVKNHPKLEETARSVSPGRREYLSPGVVVTIREDQNLNVLSDHADAIYLASPYFEAIEQQKQRLTLLSQALSAKERQPRNK